MLVVIMPLCGNTRYGNAAATSSLSRYEVTIKVESTRVVTHPTNGREQTRSHSCFNFNDLCNVLNSALLIEAAFPPKHCFFAQFSQIPVMYWITKIYAI